MDPDALKLIRADKGFIIWIDLDCPTEEETKQILEKLCEFHPLAIEDCVMSNQLPKLEDYDDYLFMIMHAVDFSRKDKFSTSELDLFLGKDFLITFHTVPLKFMQAMKERFTKQAAPAVRGPDRLAHFILDAMIDNYTSVVDELTGELEDLEDIILDPKGEESIEDILTLRKELSYLRQIVRPQRDVIGRLARGENKFIRSNLWPYFRDLYDNLTRIDETGRNYTERLMLDFDVYMNRSANEANEGIKVLTALTAITLPPVIVGSWYGMNFKFMPELNSPASYWLALVATGLGVLGMWMWLKSKKWF